MDGLLENSVVPSYFGGIERLFSSIKERSCICDINISTSSFDPTAVETSPEFPLVISTSATLNMQQMA